ncbi:MAG: EF-P lysine aminoacylase GenX [Fibrobacter sp.]|jgi:lysyl-tRNA synthetase class 2|nr:EF-P lysine aminoacylase GenX [Fibrobacter sp.]
MSFRPTAARETWICRQKLLRKTRSFFEERGVLEVETPVLSRAGGTDPHLDYFETVSPKRYLMTSPEFHMKRLLSAGFGDIFQITKAFRKEESGARHNPEFSILEWYRLGYSMETLMDEVEQLCSQILGSPVRAKRTRWEDAFKTYGKMDPFEKKTESWISACKQMNIPVPQNAGEFEQEDWWDYWMVMVIEPELGKTVPEFIWYYPPSQAALAQITEDTKGNRWACRFELYIHNVELCNGYQELLSAEEQAARFQEDTQLRKKMGKPEPETDSLFLEALRAGMPACSGVALGLDRLFMLALSKERIEDVLFFPDDIA